MSCGRVDADCLLSVLQCACVEEAEADTWLADSACGWHAVQLARQMKCIARLHRETTSALHLKLTRSANGEANLTAAVPVRLDLASTVFEIIHNELYCGQVLPLAKGARGQLHHNLEGWIQEVKGGSQTRLFHSIKFEVHDCAPSKVPERITLAENT